MRDSLLWLRKLYLFALALASPFINQGQTVLNETFNSNTLPTNWVSNSKADGTGYKSWLFVNTSSRCATTDHTSGSGYYAMLDDYNIGTTENPVNLVTPALNLSTGNYTLEFYAWVGSGAGSDPIKVDISTNNGTDWSTDIYTVTKATTGSWVKHSVDLTGYNGSEVKIKFKGYSIYGFSNNNSGIDDVKVYIPLNNDLSASSISAPSGIIRDGDNVTLTATVLNNGLLPQTDATIEFFVDGSSIGSETIASLAAGESTSVQKEWVATQGDHTISFNLPSDDDNGNNSSSKSIKVYSENSLIENFEGAWIPSGWSVNPTSSTWQQQTWGQYEGAKCVYISTSNSPVKRLITPKLKIDGTSSISFWAKNGSYGNYAIKLEYSTDKISWSDVPSGSVTTTSTYQDFTIDLSAIPAGDYYLSFTYALSYKSIYVDLVRGPDKVVEAPEAATTPSPANSATDISLTPTLTWAASVTGGIPTGYKLYIGTDGGGATTPTSVVNGNSQAGTSYTVGAALAYSTTYYWQVVPTNSVGDAASCPIWSFTTMADPTKPIPYTQNFDELTALPSLGWTVTNYSINNTHGTAGSKSASVEMWSLTNSAILTSTPVGPLANTSNQVVFDYRICDNTYSNYPQTGTSLGVNDKVEVQVSTNGGADFTTVYTIDQGTHAASTDFATKIVTLDPAYNNQTVLVRFKNTWGAGDYFVDIDNFEVRESPADPIFNISITAFDFGFSKVGNSPSTTVTISNTGGGTITLNDGDITFTGANADQFSLGTLTYPIELGVGESTDLTVSFTPSTGGVMAAELSVAHNASGSPATVSLSGEAYEPYSSFTENFDGVAADELPKGWIVTTTGWAGAYVVAANQHSGANALEMSKWGTDYAYTATPAVANITLNRLRFWSRASAAAVKISVGTMTDPSNSATYTELKLVDLTTTYAEYTVDFSSYAGSDTYLAFKTPAGSANPYIYIDDVVWEALPTQPVLGVDPTSYNFGMVAAANTSSKQFTILNQGAGILEVKQADLTFSGTNASEFNLGATVLPLSIASGESATLEILFTPASEGSKEATLSINHNGTNPAVDVTLLGTALKEGSLIEDFNGSPYASAWTKGTGWSQATWLNAAYEGDGCAYISAEITKPSKLITPKLAVESGDKLTFFTKTTATTPFPALNIMYATDINGTWNAIGSAVQVSTSSYVQHEVDLSEIAGQNCYIAFVPSTTVDYKAIYIDLVTGPALFVNTAPEFTSTAVTEAKRGHVYTYNVSATDTDNDALTFTATGLPETLVLTDNGNGTATITGTPSQVANYNVTISVNDGTASVDQTFEITVTDNSAPAITSANVESVNQDAEYSYTIEATDADGDAISFTADNVPSWLSLTDNGDGTANLVGTPAAYGNFDVSISVSDGIDVTPLQFSINVVRQRFDVTFNVTNGTAPMVGSTVTLTGYEPATTSSEGVVTIANVSVSNSISFQVEHTGYHTHTGNVVVTNQNVDVNVTLNQITYSVTFNVTDGSNPVQGAAVVLTGHETVYTNEQGSALITNVVPASNIAYTITKSGFNSISGTVSVTTGDVTVNNILGVTTYTVTFNVTNGTNPIENASVTITGYPSVTTNAEGVATVNNVSPAAEMLYTISKTGYSTKEGNVSVSNADVSVNESLDLLTYSVSFTVTNGSTPVENAEVTLAGYPVAYTNAEGVATIQNVVPASNIEYTVSKGGYTTSNGTVSVTNQDVTENVSLALITYNLTVTVANQTENLSGATVTLNQTISLQTNALGVAEFTNLTPGTYSYTVTLAGYYERTGSVIVDSDKAISVTLTSLEVPTYDISFTVTSTSTPVSDATISIQELGSATTNSNGVAVYTNVLAGTYSYSIEKEGYQTATGTTTVTNADVSLNVELTQITFTISASAGSNGTITPSGDVTVPYNCNKLFSFEADNGYHIAEVMVDGANMGAISEYQFTNVTANHTISVQFAENLYSLTFVVESKDGAVSNAVVLVNGESHTTNANGSVIVNLPNGTYAYSINADGFTEVTGEVTIANENNSVTISLIATGIDNNLVNSIGIYPNPVASRFTINNASEIGKITVSNLIGQVVIIVYHNGSPERVIETPTLKPGIYLVTITLNNGKKVVKKIVKE